MPSNEINVVAVLHPKKDKVDELISLFDDLAKWVRANEPGTLKYEVSRSLRPGKDGHEDVLMIEKYKDAEAMKIHGGSAPFKAFQKELVKKDLMRAPAQLHTASSKGGFASRL